jgi:hypothetical protein
VQSLDFVGEARLLPLGCDYGMRTAGDLEPGSRCVTPTSSQRGNILANHVITSDDPQAFSLSKADFQREYFSRFEDMCREIKGAEPHHAADLSQPSDSVTNREPRRLAPTADGDRSPTMRAERAKLKSWRDDMKVAQGKRGTSAALG